MRWDNVVGAALTALRGSTSLTSVVAASDVVMNGERAFKVPSIEWTLINDGQGELFETLLVQFDIWTRDVDDIVTAETAMRDTLHAETWRTLGGIKMRSQYAGGRNLVGPEDGVLGRSLDFEFESFHERFAVTFGSETA